MRVVVAPLDGTTAGWVLRFVQCLNRRFFNQRHREKRWWGRLVRTCAAKSVGGSGFAGIVKINLSLARLFSRARFSVGRDIMRVVVCPLDGTALMSVVVAPLDGTTGHYLRNRGWKLQ